MIASLIFRNLLSIQTDFSIADHDTEKYRLRYKKMRYIKYFGGFETEMNHPIFT